MSISSKEAHNASSEGNQDQHKSDTHMLLAPLFSYGFIALLMAGLVVSFTLILTRDLNSMDEQILTAEAHIASLNAGNEQPPKAGSKASEISPVAGSKQANQPEPISTPEKVTSTNAEARKTRPADSTNKVNTKPHTTTAVSMLKISNRVRSNVSPEPRLTKESKQPEPKETPAMSTSLPDPLPVSGEIARENFDQSRRQRIEQRNSYLIERDKQYLERFRDSQNRQIEFLREQLASQKQRIEKLEQRNEVYYELRESDIKRIQERRRMSLDQI